MLNCTDNCKNSYFMQPIIGSLFLRAFSLSRSLSFDFLRAPDRSIHLLFSSLIYVISQILIDWFLLVPLVNELSIREEGLSMSSLYLIVLGCSGTWESFRVTCIFKPPKDANHVAIIMKRNPKSWLKKRKELESCARNDMHWDPSRTEWCHPNKKIVAKMFIISIILIKKNAR